MAITTRNLKNVKTNPELGREVKAVWSMGLTENLPFDPSKWLWGSTNKTMECLFFNYSAQIGYKTDLDLKLQRSRLFEKLTQFGLSKEECKSTIALIWDKNKYAKMQFFAWQNNSRELATCS
jgi:hypothetical protein